MESGKTTMARRSRKTETGFRLSKEFAAFDQSLAEMTAHLAEHAERLGVQEEQVNQLNALKEKWDPAFDAYKTPDTHNAVTVLTAQRLHETGMKTLLRPIRRKVKNDSFITITSEDYAAMGIRPNKETRTPVSTPALTPDAVQIEVKPRSNKFWASFEKDGELHRYMPYKTHLEISVAYTADGAEPKPEDYVTIKESWRMRFVIVHPPDVPSVTRGFLRLRFVSSRGEPGSYSRPIQFVVN